MFDTYCEKHGGRVLIWTSLITSIRNTPEGIEVAYRCTCGQPGVWRTGRSRTRAREDRRLPAGTAPARLAC